MLHDPGSYSPPLNLDEIKLDRDEKEVLRSLGDEIARIAASPTHAENARLWRRLNDLDQDRPMVWINEIPWHEMDVDHELALRCRGAWARELETTLRRTIYQWKHMPGDMVVNPWLDSPLALHSTDFGIVEDVDIVRTDSANEIVSRHFKVQIRNPEDIEKIQMPTVTHSAKTTEVVYETMRELYGDVMPVRKLGQTHIWFTPWDYLIRWWGIEEAMIDMIDRPEMVHSAYERMVDAWMTELDQFETQGLLALDNANVRIGSGGYGYVSDLPEDSGGFLAGAPERHVGLLERADTRLRVAGDALGVRHGARPALDAALGSQLLRVLRAPGPEGRPARAHPGPAQGLGEPLERLQAHLLGHRAAVGGEREAQPRHLPRRRVERGGRAGIDRRDPRPGRRRGRRRRAHHEGHLHGGEEAATALGLGADRLRGGAGAPRSLRDPGTISDGYFPVSFLNTL